MTEDKEVMQGFASRLAKAMAHAGLPEKTRGSKAKLASVCHVDHKTVRKWLAGESMPAMAHGVTLANFLGVSFNWLMAGQGQMIPRDGLEPDGLRVALAWPHLTNETKTSIKKLLEIGFRQDASYEKWHREMAEKVPSQDD